MPLVYRQFLNPHFPCMFRRVILSPTMLKNLLLLGLATFVVGQPDDDDIPTGASVTDDEMGPAAFMWPADRVWAGDVDNRAPCGSRASAGNRTEFPLSLFHLESNSFVSC
jgi:hypothetical protein